MYVSHKVSYIMQVTTRYNRVGRNSYEQSILSSFTFVI